LYKSRSQFKNLFNKNVKWLFCVLLFFCSFSKEVLKFFDWLLRFVLARQTEASGPAPLSTRWTILCLDFQYILSMYLNRKYAYIKGVRLCANMLVKNIFTSDNQYEPGTECLFYWFVLFKP